MTEEINDDEAAKFLEIFELGIAMDKANRISYPQLRETAATFLMEEGIQSVAKLADDVLAKADAGEFELSDEEREAALDVIGLAVDRPDWYRPGDRMVVPDEDEDAGGTR
jgi:hypothetical protein